jgi:uncharacterized peroxidase-related enzyme
MSTTSPIGFTLDPLLWRPWIETVDDLGPTEEQEALLQKVAPRPQGRPYYAVLAHDVPALRERTGLFNAIMYGQGGLRRADRELATVATSRINGCPYCASVHARRVVELTKESALVQRLLDEGIGAELPARERLIVDLAAKVTDDPDGMTAADLAPMRGAGFSDAEILDVILSAAMFAWANRLMQTLGEPTRDPSA